MSPDRVVVGVDFDDASLEAVRWTSRHFLPDAERVLVHAVDLRDPPPYLGPGGSEERAEGARRDASDRLADLQQELQGDPDLKVGEGRPDEVLAHVADARNAALIAVGRGSSGAGLLGSTAERLVNVASVPVLMIPESPGAAPEEMLGAVDGSPETKEVLAWARLLADRHEGGVTVTHVFQPTFTGIGGVMSASTSREELAREQKEQAWAWLEEEIQEAGFPRHRVTTEVREGDPATQILDETRSPRPDLIIIGSRGPGAMEKALLGSVATSVLRGASRPVLVVRR